MPFFTTHVPKPIFAGLDDPFNFPTTKMRYTTRPASPASTTDSGYFSNDDDAAPPSPKAHIRSKNKRQLQKTDTGHWRVQTCESTRRADDSGEERGLATSLERGRGWIPDPKRTFTGMNIDAPRKEKWYTTRLYSSTIPKRDMTALQRSMAPTLRHASPAAALALLDSDTRCAPTRSRETNTLLNTARSACPRTSDDDRNKPRGRQCVSSRDETASCELVLRSPRNRSPTPMGIPDSSVSQPAPTPLRIWIGARGASAESVRGGWVSGSEAGEAGDEEENEEGGDESFDFGFESGVWRSSEARDARFDAEGESDAESIESAAFGGLGGVILARTALVARAQRVRVRSPGLAKR